MSQLIYYQKQDDAIESQAFNIILAIELWINGF